MPAITVNDEPVDTPPGATVSDILALLDYRSRTVAVWMDGEIVPRDAYTRTPVADGAELQIVHAIVGG